MKILKKRLSQKVDNFVIVIRSDSEESRLLINKIMDSSLSLRMTAFETATSYLSVFKQ
ncbi:MAG: hypothetical protein RO257_16745 [Candidatus Kapabacteria bacterium]|nr:hypothetical protein [Candidatus Kapabacteria bacterium]